jgi:hypothetical protein
LHSLLSSVSQSSTAGYVRITLDRAIQAVNSDSITITGSTDYNGDYSITWLSSDKKALDILHAFTVTRTGKIEGTSHRYKNSEDQIKNFPAVIMEISDTEFTKRLKRPVKQTPIESCISIFTFLIKSTF